MLEEIIDRKRMIFYSWIDEVGVSWQVELAVKG